MYIPKRYGQSKTFLCPFCSKQGVTKNKQGIPVCEKHRKAEFPEVKCVCGHYLEPRDGKFGPYFSCINCGNKSLSTVMDLLKIRNEPLQTDPKQETKTTEKTPQEKSKIQTRKKEIVITPNDVEWFS